MRVQEMSWQKCVDVSVDETRSMIGTTAEVTAHVKAFVLSLFEQSLMFYRRTFVVTLLSNYANNSENVLDVFVKKSK
jgi:hypothetical protein